MSLETKDIILGTLGVLGWAWGVIQYILTRHHHQKDKIFEKRFEVYSAFMNKADEISVNMRNDPKMIYGITTKLFSKAISGDQDDTNRALIEFNEDLLEFSRKSIQTILILNQELNKLKLVCSANLLLKVEQYKKLANDFSDEFQIALNNISTAKDINVTAKELTNIGHSDRGPLMLELWKEMEIMMRNEIGYYKQN